MNFLKCIKKTYETFFYNFVIYIQKWNVNWILSGKQRKASKKACKRYQNLLKEEKNRKENMVVNNIKFFLKKKKIKGVSINVNAIESPLRWKVKVSWMQKSII